MSRDFDGSTQYLNNANAIITGYPFTLVAWFYSDSLTATQWILGVSDSGSAAEEFGLYAGGSFAGDPVSLISRTGSVNRIASTTAAYATGTWTHAAGRGISATERYAYIDGGSEGANTVDSTPLSLDRTRIGVKAGSTAANYFDGKIADAAAWDIDIGVNAILALADGVSPLKISPANLVFYCPIFGVQDPERDYSANAYNMDLVNAPPASSHFLDSVRPVRKHPHNVVIPSHPTHD